MGMELLEICKQAKAIKGAIGILDTNTKNKVLLKVADALVKDSDYILTENAKDLKNGKTAEDIKNLYKEKYNSQIVKYKEATMLRMPKTQLEIEKEF